MWFVVVLTVLAAVRAAEWIQLPIIEVTPDGTPDDPMPEHRNIPQANGSQTKPLVKKLVLSVENFKTIHYQLLESLDIKSEPNTLQEKHEYLNRLKNKILNYIEYSSRRLWKPRQGRTHGMMKFPSNESALTTIAFLTFAVFLVNMVQKLIQKLHDKKGQTATPLAMAPMRRMSPNFNQRGRRSAEKDELTASVLKLIDDFHHKEEEDCLDPRICHFENHSLPTFSRALKFASFLLNLYYRKDPVVAVKNFFNYPSTG